MSKTKQLNQGQFIVKSKALIEARYRLSLQESHVILWLLTKIRPDDEDFKAHQLNIDEFSKMVSLKTNGQYGELQKITENLMRRVLKIHEPETGDVLQVAWLSSARYQKKKGCVLLRFDPGLKPYLLQLKGQFTKIDIIDTLKLKSIYALRVFELLLQYETIGKREISIEDLRSYCGIKEDEYANYFDLKRKVINRAKNEINEKTDILVDYEEIKTSRKITSLNFTIKPNPRYNQTEFEKMQEDKLKTFQKEYRSELALLERMMEYGLSKQSSKNLLKSYGEKRVEKSLKAIDLQVERKHVKNPKAMLLAAIKNGFDPEVFTKKK